MFTALGAASTLSKNSGKVVQFHGMPSFIEAMGIASTRVMVSMARSRSAGRTGAKPKPQLPITTEVMPCQLDSVQ